MFKHIVVLKHDAWNILFKLRSICTCHCFHTGFLQELKPLILLPGYFWQRHKRFHHFIFSFYSHCFTYLHQIFVTSPCHVTLCEKRNKHRQRKNTNIHLSNKKMIECIVIGICHLIFCCNNPFLIQVLYISRQSDT